MWFKRLNDTTAAVNIKMVTAVGGFSASNMMKVLFLVIGLCSYGSVSCRSMKPTDEDFDVFVFSRNWIKTACKQWEAESSHNSCQLPSDQDQWLIHGLWPNKLGSDNLPSFCNDSWPFSENEVTEILPSLRAKWMSVHSGGESSDCEFWGHEWSRHGTCAASLPSLSSQEEYFSKGLELNEKYDIETILSQGGVDPRSDPYSPSDIWSALSEGLGAKPIITCYTHDGETYISEVEICFDKSFSLLDCVGKSGSSESDLIHCNGKEEIIYN